MSKEEIKDILEELHLVRPEILKPKAKKLFEAIICIADERDILLEQNQKYKEVIDKIDNFVRKYMDEWSMNGDVWHQLNEILILIEEVK